MSAIETGVVLLKNGQVQVFWPGYGIDQIGEWVLSEGYRLYLSNLAVLPVSGAKLEPDTMPIPLGAGWNMTAYLRESELAIETALAGISGELVLVKDGAGKIYWPDMTINDIGSMQPGQGYQIFMEGAATLTYPAN